MNYGSLLAQLLRDLPDAEPMDAIAALRQAHRHVQRAADWQAQERRFAGLAYGAGGVALPDGVELKRARAVFAEHGGRLEELEPSSENYENLAALEDVRRPERVRWFQRDGAVRLAPEPTEALTVTLDALVYLPFYEDVPVGGPGQPSNRASVRDWFSDGMSETLLAGAAYYLARGSRSGGPLLQEFEALLREAELSDRRAKAAGAAGGVRPPRLNPITGAVFGARNGGV